MLTGMNGGTKTTDNAEGEGDGHDLELGLAKAECPFQQSPESVALRVSQLWVLAVHDHPQNWGGRGRRRAGNRSSVMNLIINGLGLGQTIYRLLVLNLTVAICVRLVRVIKVLGIDQFEVGSVSLDELLVGALLHDPAAGHDNDLVGIADGREAMGDDDGGATDAGLLKGSLDDGFRFGVES